MPRFLGTAILLVSFLFSHFSFAGEWTGKCRPVLDDEKHEVKTGPFQRLQSSYSFPSPKLLIWKVSSFEDKLCKDLHDADRHTFRCESVHASDREKCTQTLWEHSTITGTWEEKPLKDPVGNPIVMVMEVSVKHMGNQLVVSTFVTGNDEADTEILNQ